MELALPRDLLDRYTSARQQARVATEPWAARNLFCPACESPRLEPLPANTPARDLVCPRCEEGFQLKSSKAPFVTRIPDSAYSEMRKSILRNVAASIFALHYDAEGWEVRNLILIPRFAISLSAIHKRNPSLPEGRPKPWVGCDIILTAIPQSARIPVILNGIAQSARGVRRDFHRLQRLERRRPKNRRWTLDVLRFVQELGKKRFGLDDVYAFAPELARLHPGNRHVREKIRQQLQVLRDKGLLRFLGPGEYELTDD